ncbi:MULTISPECIES: heme o synthase [Methylobacterium]|uniref:Protoheme IX farnesyltransferase n=1 Tax=Methylobacterium jeotgali TaxID=381630 RepID=A0ABQ4SX91_9HYPH|nr:MULTISPECIES: heme o synthase [Methylobacterium]PIU05152.1 MAG: protoheme IX farnesyltransferase [Methylobacterium sp. CG09_land_8_20_14_0_10_71_15]PIU12899.1 MAG: protoheme IX farnesyltransferase [Methylobacterium sp. CG08_land_8_20_14_0_20_71_15]GBU17559.1 protoheme IX farnesyltransferase [Methylobacterium sp.]GJE07093.1 Protoheme IX farnesyltransferase [Methylobacterium jeotgali]
MTSVTNTLPSGDARIPAASVGGDVPDYFALLKPRVMALVIFTALVGMVVSHGHVQPIVGFISLLMIAIGAGASGCLNMWWDADIDAVMTRTAKRPIPDGRIRPDEALAFGLVLSVGSVLVLGLAANWLAAGLLAFTIVFYAVIYSMWLKRTTAQNIVIGGAAGALPPVIGQAVVTGSVGIESLVLFAIIFIWTPPHFWALALVKAGEYARAGIPMMPNTAGPESTRRQIVAYTLLLAPLGLAPVALGFGGLIYAVVALLGGLAMVAFSIQVLRHREGEAEKRAAMGMFGFSILYLFALFSALLAEQSFGLFRAVIA